MSSPAQILLNPPGAQGTRGLAKVRDGQTLAVSVDTLVAGVHFPTDTPPRDIGHKVLAVNLSDMAAMGAEPSWVTLCLTLPDDEPDWLDDFAHGFLALAQRFELQILTVEKTRGPQSFTVEIGGTVPHHQALRRDGARPGELIFVTGTLGDAGAALATVQKRLSLADTTLAALLARLNRPEPRVHEGLALRGLATSAIDVSDGLAPDLGHILERSGVGAAVEVNRIPLSPSVLEAIGQEAAWHTALTSGDDYELCFTLPPDRQRALARVWRALACPITPIGRVVKQRGLSVHRADGTGFGVGRGYEHFT